MFKRIAIATLALTALTGIAKADRMEDAMGAKTAEAFATVKVYKKVCPLDLPAGAKAMLTSITPYGKKVLNKYLPAAMEKTEADAEKVGNTKWCEIVESVMFSDFRK